MNIFVNKLINFIIFFSVVLMINSCSHYRIQKLEEHDYDKKDFYQLLSFEYLKLAKFELYKMHDEIDANLFAHKSSLAKDKNIFYPENPSDWNISQKYERTANILYDKINKFMINKVYLEYPENFSQVLSAYDCWIEQIEENWQTDHIDACYEKLNKNLEIISMKLSEIDKKINEESIELSKNKNNLKSENDEYKQNKKETSDINKKYKLIVFFEFDKFNLSSEQIIELETFIDKAKKNSDRKIFVEGHTDTMGSKLYNLKLSEKRANFIKEYLINKNLVNIIETISFGEEKPLIPSGDQVKEKQNRRAEIYLK